MTAGLRSIFLHEDVLDIIQKGEEVKSFRDTNEASTMPLCLYVMLLRLLDLNTDCVSLAMRAQPFVFSNVQTHDRVLDAITSSHRETWSKCHSS